MFCKKKVVRLSREEEQQLFALDELIQRAGHPDRPTRIQHPVKMRLGYSKLTDEELDIIDAQDRIKRILGIDTG